MLVAIPSQTLVRCQECNAVSPHGNLVALTNGAGKLVAAVCPHCESELVVFIGELAEHGVLASQVRMVHPNQILAQRQDVHRRHHKHQHHRR